MSWFRTQRPINDSAEDRARIKAAVEKVFDGQLYQIDTVELVRETETYPPQYICKMCQRGSGMNGFFQEREVLLQSKEDVSLFKMMCGFRVNDIESIVTGYRCPLGAQSAVEVGDAMPKEETVALILPRNALWYLKARAAHKKLFKI